MRLPDRTDRTSPNGSRRVDRELENLRAAITWATGVGETDLAMDLLGAVPGVALNTALGYVLCPWAQSRSASPARRTPRCGAVLASPPPTTATTTGLSKPKRDACEAIASCLTPENVFSILPWGVLLQIYAYSGHAEKFLAVPRRVPRCAP